MAWVEVKRGRRINGTVEKKWEFFTSNGESLGKLTYTKLEIQELFPEATIKGTKVFL
jgi:hypothetical protein